MVIDDSEWAIESSCSCGRKKLKSVVNQQLNCLIGISNLCFFFCFFAIVSQNHSRLCFIHLQWLIKLRLEPETSSNNIKKQTSSCSVDTIYGPDTKLNCVCYIVTV